METIVAHIEALGKKIDELKAENIELKAQLNNSHNALMEQLNQQMKLFNTETKKEKTKETKEKKKKVTKNFHNKPNWIKHLYATNDPDIQPYVQKYKTQLDEFILKEKETLDKKSVEQRTKKIGDELCKLIKNAKEYEKGTALLAAYEKRKKEWDDKESQSIQPPVNNILSNPAQNAPSLSVTIPPGQDIPSFGGLFKS